MRMTAKSRNYLFAICTFLLLSILIQSCRRVIYTNINGWVYLDVNGNNIRDEGDTAVPGIKVKLFGHQDGPSLQTTITDENGQYTFTLKDLVVSNDGYVQFAPPDDYVFVQVDAGADDVDSDANSTGKATFDRGREENNNLWIDALIQKAPVSQTPDMTPTPTTAPTIAPTATPIPRAGFSDPKEDAISAITGQPIPAGYPALDILEVDWKIEDEKIFIDVVLDIPLMNNPEVFEWGIQAGVMISDRLIFSDYAILPDGVIDQQFSTITGTLTTIPTATLVTWTKNERGVDTAQFTFDNDVSLTDDAFMFVRGFSRVSELMGVIDNGLWSNHPAINISGVIPFIPVNSTYVNGRPTLSGENWDQLYQNYGFLLYPVNHSPGWQVDRYTSFSDPVDDVYNADSFTPLGEPDSAVDIRFVDVNPGITETLAVDIFLATSPMSTTLTDFSFYSEVAVRDDEGQEYVVAYEIHDGQKRQGLLDLSSFQIVPGTASYVRILPDRINMIIPGKPSSGEILVSNFHMKTENSVRTYDELINNSFLLTTQYDIDAALGTLESALQTDSTNTPEPTATQFPTPTATPTLQPPTLTPTLLPPTATPTVIPSTPEDNGLGEIMTSTFVVTDTGDLTPVDVANLFLTGYGIAHDENNDEWLLGSLHSDSIERYGLSQCQAYLKQVTGCCEDFNAVDSEYPVEFVFDKDGIVTTYADAVRLLVVFTVKGETQPRESPMHIITDQSNGFWYANWFTDCGTPE